MGENQTSLVHEASRRLALALERLMSRNYYAEINLHITWHTKESSPLLVPNVEAIVHHYLRSKLLIG